MEYREPFLVLIVVGILIGALAVTGPYRPDFISRNLMDMDDVEVAGNQVCFQTGYQDAECFDFSNVYHEGLLPLTVNGVNQDFKTLFVTVDSYFVGGSDGACAAFGALINNMLESMPEGWQIYVQNPWVPSKENPIDLGWSRTLAEGY